MSNQVTRPDPARKVVGPIQLNEMPTIRGRDGAVAFINDVFGVPVSPTRMRAAIERRELPVYKIGGCNYTAERDLYLWVKSLARPVADDSAASA